MELKAGGSLEDSIRYFKSACDLFLGLGRHEKAARCQAAIGDYIAAASE
jgi:hypothetical protein